MTDVRDRLRAQCDLLLKERRGGVTLDRDTLVNLLADADAAITSGISRQLRPPQRITLDDEDLDHWWSVVQCGELRNYTIGTIEQLVSALIERVWADDQQGRG